MKETKTFILNGHQYITKEKVSLYNLVTYFNYNKSLLVLEYNNLICNRKDWKKIVINDHDQIEIVTIVGGG